jgi:hypothetical protein
MKYRGRVEGGILKLDQVADFNEHLKEYEGKLVTLSITGGREDRSIEANRYYWGCVVTPLAKHCGYTREQMHEALKRHFLRDREREKDGLILVRSTTELDTKEFAEYVSHCQQLAAEMHCVLPDEQGPWIA